jgi:signal transduction histidine kinase
MDINELARSIVADWIPSFRKKGIAFQIDISNLECNIFIDKSAFVRILNNLIQNAFIHSGGDHIDVSINTNDKQVSILVSDNGVGITEDKLPFIFDRLYKCDESRSVEGNGLGLAIVKELVKAHKGSIIASSIPNTITTFTVILPINSKLC